MKKLFTLMMALMLIGVFATSSFAVNGVQMTLTSPTIYKVGCEKIGATTYSFDSGSTIVAGDWWYMDLPENVTLCKNYNYVIAGNDADNQAYPNVYINSTIATPYTKVAFNGANLSYLNNNEGTGPYVAGGVLKNVLTSGNIAFLVKGTSGSRRITIYALTPINAPGTLTVEPDSLAQFKLFDGKSWSQTGTPTADKSVILIDRDGDGTYGENETGTTIDEVIAGDCDTNATTGVPYVENTLCSNNTQMSGQYLYTSYASRVDKFLFTGDSQIAHTAAAGSITLEACKGLTTFDIEVSSSQGATCWFEYDVVVASNGNYCDTNWPTNGQRFLIKAATGSFGDIEDKYWIDAEIVAPASGVYFSATPTIALYKSTEDSCAGAGTATGATFTPYEGATAKTASDYPGVASCTIASGKRINKVMQNLTTVFMTDNYNQIFVNFAPFAFGNTLVTVGNSVQVKVTLSKYPCGEIFNATRTIGTFITSCTASTATTLLFPWLPGTGATGWWGGFVITNYGNTAGAATLTYRDSAGATATYTTPSIPASGQWANTGVTAANLTAGTGTYDGTLNFSISASCPFNARGFAFIGNGNEGTGYAVHP